MDEASARAGMTSLLTRPAVELAAMIRRGEVRSRELVEASLRQIEARRDLNAFTLVTADEALAVADSIQPGDPRPFAGVPIAIKELNAVTGQPQTMGCDLFGAYRAPVDAYVVRRLKAAGFVLVGRTSSPEFGIVPVTEPRRFGPTRNPWDINRTPGGSSGGAGAAVAAGILPVAQGSDGGGSLRIPAACCGLVGLKPSRGRISPGPELGESFLSTNGALTRYVSDSAALLDVMAGYEVGDATWAPASDEPFAQQAARAPKRLRVALTTVSPLGTPVDPMCAQAAVNAAQLLRELGHEVEEVMPPEWPSPELARAFKVLWAAGFAASVRWGASVAGHEARPEDVEAVTWMFYQQGIALSAADYVGAMTQLQQFTRRLVGFLYPYDVLLTPALAQRPLPIGYLDTCGADPEAEFRKAEVFTPFTPGFNVTGQPAISIPLYPGPDGLPLAVQFVGKPLGEGTLLSLAAQLEAVRPWAGRMPGTPGTPGA